MNSGKATSPRIRHRVLVTVRQAVGWCAVFALIAVPVPSANAQSGPAAPADLFSDAGFPTARDRGLPTVSRSRTVRVNSALLQPARAVNGSQTVNLNLFPDTAFVADLRLSLQTSSPSSIWTGSVQGRADSQVTLVARDGVVIGNVRVGLSSYQVRFVGGDLHRVLDVDLTKFPPESPPIPVTVSGPQTFASPSLAADDASIIGVLVVYTSTARAAAGGTAAMEAEIDAVAAETNAAYTSSGITPQIAVVKMEVEYQESGNLSTDLGRLQTQGDGYLDSVHTARDEAAADLVALIVEDSGSSCGLAYLMNPESSTFETFAFSAVGRACATGNLSFVHELGHNMGARHDRFVDNADGPFTYNHGYFPPSGAWRTIMAYPNGCSGCPRVAYFSNPDVTYLTEAMGVAEGSPTSADNRKTLNNTALTAANFRQGALTTPVPTVAPPKVTISGAGFGTFLQATSTVSWGDTPITDLCKPPVGPVLTSSCISKWTEKSIAVLPPSGHEGDAVEVRVNGGNALTATVQDSTFYYGPVVTGLKPRQGLAAGGAKLSISGAGFGSSSGTVNWGAADITALCVKGEPVPAGGCITKWSAKSVALLTPSGSDGTSKAITVNDGEKATDVDNTFHYGSLVTGLKPQGGAISGGGKVTISGLGFGLTSGTVNWDAGTISAACPTDGSAPPAGGCISKWSEKAVAILTPTGDSGTSKPVKITPSGGVIGGAVTSKDTKFYYGSVVTGLKPQQGAATGGAKLTISGIGFGAFAQDTSKVNWGATPITASCPTDGSAPPAGGCISKWGETAVSILTPTSLTATAVVEVKVNDGANFASHIDRNFYYGALVTGLKPQGS